MLQTDAADVAVGREGRHGEEVWSGQQEVPRLHPKISAFSVTFVMEAEIRLNPQRLKEGVHEGVFLLHPLSMYPVKIDWIEIDFKKKYFKYKLLS